MSKYNAKQAAAQMAQKRTTEMKQAGVLSNSDMAKIAGYAKMLRASKDPKERKLFHEAANKIRTMAGLVAGRDYDVNTGRFTKAYEIRAAKYRATDAKKYGNTYNGMNSSAYVDSRRAAGTSGNGNGAGYKPQQGSTGGIDFNNVIHTYDSDFGKNKSNDAVNKKNRK